MRKASMISMCIVLFALVGMMVAADFALKPMKVTMAIGRDLTATLGARGDVQPDTKILVYARRAETRHLAKDGWGMIIELDPSDAVRSRKGRLDKLARRAAHMGAMEYNKGKARALEWIEVRFGIGDDPWHRSLLLVDKHGNIGQPSPAVPPTWVAALK